MGMTVICDFFLFFVILWIFFIIFWSLFAIFHLFFLFFHFFFVIFSSFFSIQFLFVFFSHSTCVCVSPENVGKPRYWRLALLSLKWIRIGLRGPLYSIEGNALAKAAAAEPFYSSQCVSSFSHNIRKNWQNVSSSNVMMGNNNNNNSYNIQQQRQQQQRQQQQQQQEDEYYYATCWLYRCFLSVPTSPVFKTLMKLICVHGHVTTTNGILISSGSVNRSSGTSAASNSSQASQRLGGAFSGTNTLGGGGNNAAQNQQRMGGNRCIYTLFSLFKYIII